MEDERHVVAGEDVNGEKYKVAYPSYQEALEAARDIVEPELKKAMADYEGPDPEIEPDSDYEELSMVYDFLFKSDDPDEHESGLDPWSYLVTQGFGVSSVGIY